MSDAIEQYTFEFAIDYYERKWATEERNLSPATGLWVTSSRKYMMVGLLMYQKSQGIFVATDVNQVIVGMAIDMEEIEILLTRSVVISSSFFKLLGDVSEAIAWYEDYVEIDEDYDEEKQQWAINQLVTVEAHAERVFQEMQGDQAYLLLPVEEDDLSTFEERCKAAKDITYLEQIYDDLSARCMESDVFDLM